MKTPNADSVGGHSAFYCDKVEACACGTRSFSLEIDKVICIVISPQKKVYILLKCVFLQ